MISDMKYAVNKRKNQFTTKKMMRTHMFKMVDKRPKMIGKRCGT